MKQHTRIAAGTVLAAGLLTAPALAAGTGPQVSVRIEGLTGTVLAAKSITLPSSGSITKDGVKAGQCLAATAQGALQVATGGNWRGSWYASYKEYEVTSILGNTPNAKSDYYEIFVNDKAASAGACELKLKAGDQLLFAAVPDKGKAETPLVVTWTISNSKLLAKVVAYNAQGKATALEGAKVTTASGSAVTASAVTDADGVATFTAPSKPGTEKLLATAAGHIRAETTVQTVS